MRRLRNLLCATLLIGFATMSTGCDRTTGALLVGGAIIATALIVDDHNDHHHHRSHNSHRSHSYDYHYGGHGGHGGGYGHGGHGGYGGGYDYCD